MFCIKYPDNNITEKNDMPKNTRSNADKEPLPQYFNPCNDEFKQYCLRFSQALALVDDNLSLFKRTTRDIFFINFNRKQRAKKKKKSENIQLNLSASETEMKRAFHIEIRVLAINEKLH